MRTKSEMVRTDERGVEEDGACGRERARKSLCIVFSSLPNLNSHLLKNGVLGERQRNRKPA